MTVSLLLAEGSTLSLLAKVVVYTLVYSILVFLPLRGFVAVIFRLQAAARKRKEARSRKPRVVRSYVVR